MIQGIQQWLIDGNESYDFSTHPTDAHLHLVHLAYIDQSSIGWGTLLRGRIVTAWLRAHDQYHSRRYLRDKYPTTRFAPALVRHLWDFSLAIWKHRNDDVHGATDDASKEKQEKILDAKITAANQHPDQHSDTDRLVLFTKSLPDRLKARYASKVKWLSLPTHLLHAPDTPADEPPPPSRAVYNMFRPLASLMRHITTTTVPPPSTNTPFTSMTRS
jgi:hypothetical protein